MAHEIAVKIDERYEVLGELGRGGMGIVYKANDPKMDRLVAIKVMTSHGRDEYQERFLREAKAIAKLQHPNIVVVHDYGQHRGAPYMVMEYVEGIPLDKVIASRVSLTPLAKVDYVIQVCQALHYAHQQNIVHRDVKPGNIMVLEGGKRVKLLDFGIARAGGVSNLSKSGLAMGTTCYMSPEQTKGQKDLDGRADIFSAGVVLYELLAGRPPWTGEGDYEVMTKIIHDPYPPLSDFLRNYPSALDQVLEMALAKDAGARYRTAEIMALELAELEIPLKEQVLEEALVQFESGDLLRASDLVSQILRIDTRHREAQDLQNKLQRVAQLKQRTEQVLQLRTAAEQAVGQKRYSDALEAVEQAISIDSANTELFHYRELIRHEVRRRDEVRKKLELARRAQEINDLSTAQELVEKALEADPTDTQARMMKSSLEQEKKKQQQQEIAEDVSRALAARAFGRVRELIQQLEALDPAFPPLGSLKKALQEGEEEEKRSIEIENLIRQIRQILEAGNLVDCLSLSEQALSRFPGDTRLMRLHAQAEAMRDKAEHERAIQEQIDTINKLAETGRNPEALAAAENAIKSLGTEYRLQSLAVQIRQTIEREHQVQAEQAVLARARNAIAGNDLELAVKILNQARVDFSDSKEIMSTLEIARAAITKKADETRALETSKRKITEDLERSLIREFDPEGQIKLAEEALRKLPDNEAVKRVLLRVRERQQQIASAVERGHRFEQSQRYADALGQWERVRQLWPQYPQLSAQTARLTAALQAPRAAGVAEPVATTLPSGGLSATSMMATAPAKAPSAAAQVRREATETPTPSKPQFVQDVVVARPAESSRAAEAEMEVRPAEVQIAGRTEGFRGSKKLLLAVAALAAIVIAVSLYLAFRMKKTAEPAVKAVPESHPEINVPKPVSQPATGTLTVHTNIEQVDVWVDGHPKIVTDGQSATITLVPGSHTITIQKPGYTSTPQQVQILEGAQSTLQFTLSKLDNEKQPAPDTLVLVKTIPGARVWIDKTDEGEVPTDGAYLIKTTPGNHHVEVTHEGFISASTSFSANAGERPRITVDLKPIPKLPPVITSFSASPTSIQQGQSTQLQWKVQNAAQVTIDHDIGDVSSEGSKLVNPASSTTYTLTAKGEGGELTQSVPITVIPLPKPVITGFTYGTKTIQQGQAGRLIWSTRDAVDVSINPELGHVGPFGDQEVHPTNTTTYKLTAKGASGVEVTETTQIVVDIPSVQTPALATQETGSQTSDPESKAVKDTIEVRYRAAYESRSMSELHKVWPKMRKDVERDIQTLFTARDVRAVQLAETCSTPSITGETALCRCKQSMSVTKGDDKTPVRSTVVIFQLQKSGNAWIITGMKGD